MRLRKSAKRCASSEPTQSSAIFDLALAQAFFSWAFESPYDIARRCRNYSRSDCLIARIRFN